MTLPHPQGAHHGPHPPGLVRSRAPLRLGLAGGGTDLSPFCDEHGGAVLNCTIDRYAYCFLEPRDDGQLLFRAADLGLAETHAVSALPPTETGLRLHRGLWHRFAAQVRRVSPGGVTVTTSVDAPMGSGLGSSSALVVAMCEAFRRLTGASLGLYDIARLAYAVERTDLGMIGGRQDQYSAAFGGVNFIEFLPEDRAIVNPLRIEAAILNELEAALAVCFVGVSRESASIIRQQKDNMAAQDSGALQGLFALKDAATEMKEALLRGDIPRVAGILHRSWASKQRTAAGITSSVIEKMFAAGMEAGASAGKISGAGGGGFLMFLVPPERRSPVIQALRAAGGDAGPVHLTTRGAESWLQPSPP